MMHVVLIVIGTLASVVFAYGQGGSNYSSAGIGDVIRSVGARYEGMAGTSIAMPSLQGINVVNPALLGMSPFTRIQTGYRFAQHVENGTTGKASQVNGEVDGLLALFAVDTSMGIGVSFGVLPYSNLAFATTRSFTTTGPSGTYTGSSSQSGSGGISSIHLGASYKVASVYVGLSARPLFGQMNYYDENITSTITTTSSFSQTTKYLVTGALYRVGLFTEIIPSVSLGAYYSFGSKLSYDKLLTQTAFTRETFDTLDVRGRSDYTFLTQKTSSTSELPSTLGIGLSYRTGRTQIGIDVEQGSYGNITFNPRNNVVLGNMLRATLGVSQQAAAYAPTFFDKWGYRGGIGYVQQYFSFGGYAVREYFGAVGVDFPLGQSATVDAAVQGGYRGPNVGLYEYFGRLNVSVSIGETWFKPFARD